jgi:hypothetical protein
MLLLLLYCAWLTAAMYAVYCVGIAMLTHAVHDCARFCACSRATCWLYLAYLVWNHPCASVLLAILARNSCVFNLAALA